MDHHIQAHIQPTELAGYLTYRGEQICKDSPLVAAMETVEAMTLLARMNGHGWQDTLNGYPWLAGKISGLVMQYCFWAIENYAEDILARNGYDDFGTWLSGDPEQLTAIFNEATGLEYIGS